MTTKPMTRADQVAYLKARGFDTSNAAGVGVTLGCSRCQALFINRSASHETGCPNAMRECAGCYTLVPKAWKYCEDCR